MFADLPISTIMALIGGMIGAVLGYVARRARFCTLSAVETAWYGGNRTQIRMWVFAIATAILGTLGLTQVGLVDVSGTVHMLPRIALAGPILGGLIFGLGMAAVGTCSFGAVLRGAGGDMRGFVVVLIVGVVGYMTIRGFLAFPRMIFIEPLSVPLPDDHNASLGSLISLAIGLEPSVIVVPSSVLAALALIVWCLKDSRFRTNVQAVFGSLVVGLLVVAGWYTTGHIGADEFDPQAVESLSFVAASGSTVMYLMTFTGSTITFGVGVFMGVIIGAFIAAWRKNELRLDAFDDPREMRRHIIGAVLMGIGGVLSMGCSIGQGLSGVSTLAVPSFLALLSMWVGAVLGLHILIYGWTLSSDA